MRTIFYSTKDYEKPYLLKHVAPGAVVFVSDMLTLESAVQAKGFDVVSVFTGDDASAVVLEALMKNGVRYIAIRAAGYDNVDLKKAAESGMKVANVPDYSPYAVAEHAVALILALNRKIVIADRQVHHHDFTTRELIGFDLHGKTVGILGTGKIGGVFARIMSGFGCKLLANDIQQNSELIRDYDLKYVSLAELCHASDIISIHTCLTKETKYILNKTYIGIMKKNVMIINTSRGACVKTADIIEGIEKGTIGYYGADVYENERGVFFNDYTGKELNDIILKKLLALPNVLITPHQAFATKEALANIAQTVFNNIDCWEKNIECSNEL